MENHMYILEEQFSPSCAKEVSTKPHVLVFFDSMDVLEDYAKNRIDEVYNIELDHSHEVNRKYIKNEKGNIEYSVRDNKQSIVAVMRNFRDNCISFVDYKNDKLVEQKFTVTDGILGTKGKSSGKKDWNNENLESYVHKHYILEELFHRYLDKESKASFFSCEYLYFFDNKDVLEDYAKKRVNDNFYLQKEFCQNQRYKYKKDEREAIEYILWDDNGRIISYLQSIPENCIYYADYEYVDYVHLEQGLVKRKFIVTDGKIKKEINSETEEN